MPAINGITRFGPALPDLRGTPLNQFFDQYNLLGYDNGDGELACHKVGYDASKKKLYTIPLTFREGVSLYHVPNMLVFQNPQKAELTDFYRTAAFDGTIYHNFKRCPGTRTDLTYRDDEGIATPYTYGALMAHSFACAVLHLSKCNNNFDIKKPTVIMVGRPSSKGWKDAEQDYANLLGSMLEAYLPEGHGSITIVVLSESSAAMAGAVDLKQKDWLDAVTYILDLGSSTFDLTTATPDGIPPEGEDSYQFGGNQLDKVIAANADSQFKAMYPPEDGYQAAVDVEKVTKLRFKKELCYGDNGCSLGKGDDRYNYYVLQKDASGQYRQVLDKLENEVIFSYPVVQRTMQSVLNNTDSLEALRCPTERLAAFHEVQNHNSWLAACKFVITQFYNRTEQFRRKYPNTIHRLILTGGVSNMPEVREAAKEVFHVDTVMISEEPSQTVSKGLALILGNEIVKKSILLDLEQEIMADGNGLPDANSLLDQLVQEVSDSEIKYYGAVIRHWAQRPGYSSIQDCIRDLGDRTNNLFNPLDNFAERACRNWFESQHVAAGIEKILRSKFRQLFPEFPSHFRPQIVIPDTRDLPPKDLSNNFWINLYMFFDENDCPSFPFESLNEGLRTDQRQKILDTFYHHSSALVLGTVEHRYPDGYRMRIDNSGRISGRAHENGVDVLESIDSVYRRQLSLEEDAKPLRKNILKMMKPQILDFVESLTYYLAMDNAGTRVPHEPL